MKHHGSNTLLGTVKNVLKGKSQERTAFLVTVH